MSDWDCRHRGALAWLPASLVFRSTPTTASRLLLPRCSAPVLLQGCFVAWPTWVQQDDAGQGRCNRKRCYANSSLRLASSTGSACHIPILLRYLKVHQYLPQERSSTACMLVRARPFFAKLSGKRIGRPWSRWACGTAAEPVSALFEAHGAFQ